ncbi:MAG: NAD-dependent epimerase/dehydratase family protein [Methylocella sp.]
MKILLAGATGAVGRRLIPLLTAAGHEVAGLTRSPAKAGLLRRIGAAPIVEDALDPAAVMDVVRLLKPEIVIHQLTSIPKNLDMRNFDREFALTNRLRKESTDYLLAAARAAGARRFIAQSFAGWSYAREGGAVKTEEDPLDPSPPPEFRRTLEAIRYLESAVTGENALEGLILRYGFFYGPGTAIGEHGSMVNDVRKRRVPIVGGGTGVWSFIHIDDVARFTRAAITRGAPGVYNIVDDDPAPVSQWLPALAEALRARPPRRIPAWLARFMIGDAVTFMTEARGASNAKAKRTFGINLLWPSWRDGFRSGLADPSQA